MNNLEVGRWQIYHNDNKPTKDGEYLVCLKNGTDYKEFYKEGKFIYNDNNIAYYCSINNPIQAIKESLKHELVVGEYYLLNKGKSNEVRVKLQMINNTNTFAAVEECDGEGGIFEVRLERLSK